MDNTRETAAEAAAPCEPEPLVKSAGDIPDSRACMACRQPFLSEGWHNRLCPRCRKRSEPDGW